MAATFHIEVAIDPAKAVSGAQQVGKGLKETETAADKLQRTIRNTFAGIGVALIVRELGQAADAYTNMQNRIRTVTESEAELNSVTRQLFQIANETRGAFDAVAEVYTRTASAVKALGISQDETLAFTKSLNQAVALGGSAAEESRAGLLQLSQGLASGALRGDELRSVLEQLPVVADVIAKSLGVTRGELRGLAEDGKLTAQVILDAFEQSRGELETRFAKSVPTISQAFVVLKNNIVEFVGAADQATQVSGALASVIVFASEHIDILTAGVIVLAVAALPAALSAMGALIAQSTILQGVLSGALFNPLILGVAAAGAGIILLIDHLIDVQQTARDTKAEMDKFLLTDEDLLTQSIANVEKTLERVQEQAAQGLFPDTASAQARIDPLIARIEKLREEQAALSDGTGRTLAQIRAQEAALTKLDDAVRKTSEGLVAQAAGLVETSRELAIRKTLLGELAEIEKATGKGVTPEQEAALRLAAEQAQALREQAQAFDAIKGPQEQFRAQLEALNQLQLQSRISTEEFDKAVAALGQDFKGIDLSSLDLSGLQNLDLSAIQQLLAGVKQVAEESKKSAADSIAGLEQENNVLALQVVGQKELAEQLQIVNELKSQGIDATPEEVARIEALRAQNEQLQLQADILDSLNGPQEKYLETQQALNDLLAADKITVDEYRAVLEDAAKAAGMLSDAQGGVSEGAAKIVEEVDPAGEAIQRSLTDAFRSAEDSLVAFARTGEFNFSKFVDSLLDDVARLLVQQAVFALFGGAPIGGIPGLSPHAAGGDFNAGDTLLVGEQGPEIITAKGSGEVIPAGETAARMGGDRAPNVNVAAPNVTVPITNVIQGDIKSDLATPEGEQGVLNIIRRNPETVRRA